MNTPRKLAVVILAVFPLCANALPIAYSDMIEIANGRMIEVMPDLTTGSYNADTNIFTQQSAPPDALTNSGHSTDLVSAKLGGCFRPILLKNSLLKPPL